MRSSSGQHFVPLDHLRALAAFMVFSWHFLHSPGPVALEGAPLIFPLALIDEGHTGVALFMVLSGYLFAKLLDGKNISYGAFFWNRFIRLAPLLILTFTLVVLAEIWRGENTYTIYTSLLRGFIYPEWPNGGWSITTEIHFYLILPALLWMSRQSKFLPLVIVLIALASRYIYFQLHGEVQSIAYWTIIGRIDQFTLGIVAYLCAPQLQRKKYVAYGVLILFGLFWWWFDKTGGFYLRPKYPSPSSIWIVIPTIEGLAYAALIVLYDSAKINHNSIWSRLLQRLGEYSYSIYLLHFFVVFRASEYINRRIMDISEFYIAILWSAALFTAMIIPGYLSFRFIESPFLKLRMRYIK